MRTPARPPPLAEPQKSVASRAPARKAESRAREVDEDRDGRMRRALVERVMRPPQARAAFDTGYGDLVAAARAEAPRQPGATEAPALVSARRDDGLQVGRDARSDWAQALHRGREGARRGVELPAGGGQPLPPAIRARMEAAFNHDFSHVQIHTDGASGDSARQMHASAFTRSSHVFFGHGKFAPGTPDGDRVLVHELAHVVQADEGRLPSRGGLSSPMDPHEREAHAAESGMADALGKVDAGELAAPTEVSPARSPDPVSAGGVVSRDDDEQAPGPTAPARTGTTGPTVGEDALEDAIVGELSTAASAAAAAPPAPTPSPAELEPPPAQAIAPAPPQPEADAAPVAVNAPEPASPPVSAPPMREAPAGPPPAAVDVAPAEGAPDLARPTEWSARAREEGARQVARILEAAGSAAAQVRAAAGVQVGRAAASFAAARARLEADAASSRAEIQARLLAARATLENKLTALSDQLDAGLAAREESARAAATAARAQLTQGVEAEAQRAIAESAARAGQALALADIEGGGGDEPLAAGQRDIARRVANEAAQQCVQTGADAAAEVRKAGASQLSGVDAHLDGVLGVLAQARESAQEKLERMRGASLASLEEKAAEASAEIDARVAEASATLSTREGELTGWIAGQAEAEAAAIEARASELAGPVEQDFAALAAAYDQGQAELDAARADVPGASPEAMAEIDAGIVGELERAWLEGAAPRIAQIEQAVAAMTSQGAAVSEGLASAVGEAEASSQEAPAELGAQVRSIAVRFSDACTAVEAQTEAAAQQGVAGELAEADRALAAQKTDLDAAVAEALGDVAAAVDVQLAWEDQQIATAAERIRSGQARAAHEYQSAKAEARARDQEEETTSRGWLGDLWNFFDDLARRTLEWLQEKLGRVWGNIIGWILAGLIYLVGVVVCAAAWLGAQVINIVWGFLWGETAIPGYGGGVFAFLADLLAGVLVYGDLRDIVKYWIWRPLWGEGPWWLNLLLGGIALLGVIPLLGDALKALVKGLKAGGKGALKWLAKLIGEELAERIARALGEEVAERVARRLSAELDKETAAKLIRELGAEAAEELLERLGKETLGKLAQDLSGPTIRRLADEIGERALTKLAEELSGTAIERIAGDLGQDAIEKLLRTVGGATIEALHSQLGKDALLKLLEGLRGVTIKEYLDALGGPALRKLAADLDGHAVKELMDALGAQALKRLTNDLEGAAIKQLLDELGEDTLKLLAAKLDGAVIRKLLADITAPEVKRLLAELGEDVFTRLAKDFDGPAIKQLVDELTAQVVKDLGPDALSKIGRHLTPTQIADFVRELGTYATKKLAKRYGGRAMAHYGVAFFKSWKGVTDYTVHHLVRGHGINNKKISGCHDLGRFLSQYVGSTATVEEVFIHSHRRVGVYVEYIYSVFKKDGSGLPAAAQNAKTVIDGLETGLAAWKKKIVDAIDDSIKNLTFPQAGPGFSVVIDGVTWRGFFRDGRIDSIFPTL